MNSTLLPNKDVFNTTIYPSSWITPEVMTWPLNSCQYSYCYPPYTQTVYVDKTDKALELIKALEEKGALGYDSVAEFLELVEIVKPLL